MKKPILFILLMLSCKAGYTQKQGQAAIDSMLNDLPKSKEDTNRVKLLNGLAFTYRLINPDEGIKYGQGALALATKLVWKKGIAWANDNLGVNYQHKSDYPKALEYFLSALKIFEETGEKYGIAKATGHIGTVYYDLRDYPKAMEYDFNSLKAHEKIGDNSGIATENMNIGVVYSTLTDYPKALEYTFKALKIFEEKGDKVSIALAEGNIGIVYTLQKNYAMAIAYEQKALTIAKETGDKQVIALDIGNIGEAYLSLAKDTSQASMAIDEKHNPGMAIPVSKDSQLNIAVGYFRQTIAISKEIHAPEMLEETYENLSKAYRLRGDYKTAMEYDDEGKAIKDSIFSEENKKIIERMENARDSLQAAEKDKIITMKLQRQRNYTYIGIAGILLLTGFSFFILKERKKSERERKTAESERKKSDELLLNILPGEVANELKANGHTKAKHFDNVSVLFTDFVNFTQAGERLGPQALVDELDTCFKAFDEITGKHNVEKIKTIGDAYLAVAGLPLPNPNHAVDVVAAAMEIKDYMLQRKQKMGENTFEVRIGIHSGNVVAGIVGVKKFAYDIWGDTVNTAARMEQNSEPGKVNISETTYQLVKDKFNCTYRGLIEAKNKGEIKMYFVEGGA